MYFPFPLALTLLVARVLADYENLAMATNDLAFVAHLLYRRTYFHCSYLSVTCLTLLIYHGQPLPMIFLAMVPLAIERRGVVRYLNR
jgi:hypothetical protein